MNATMAIHSEFESSVILEGSKTSLCFRGTILHV